MQRSSKAAPPTTKHAHRRISATWWIGVPLGAVAVLLVLTFVSEPELPPTQSLRESPNSHSPTNVKATDSFIAAGFPRTLSTPLGPLSLSTKPMRVVSCVPAADEILVELVSPERLWAVTHNAAVSRWSFARESLRHVPPERRIRFVAEQSDEIVAWQPDLVIVGGFTEAGFRERMRHAGIPVLVLHAPDSLSAIMANVELLAQATGEDAAGERILTAMRARLATVSGRLADTPRIGSLYIAFYGDEMSTVGSGSTLGLQLEHAGYDNLGIRLLNGPWGPVAFEQIARLDRDLGIDVMIFPAHEAANDTREPTRQPHGERFMALPGASLLGPLAGLEPRILYVPEAYIQVSSHHIVEGIEWFAAHRNRFAAKD